MSTPPSNTGISSLTGQFLDRNLEDQFLRSFILRNQNFLRHCALAVGFFFFLFAIYDYTASASPLSLLGMFACRLAFLILSVLIYFKADYFFSKYPFHMVSLYEFSLVLLFFLISLGYRNPHFFTQALAVNIIILVIFLIPNLASYKLFLSLLTFTGFVTISIFHYHPSTFDFFSACVYIFLAIIVSWMASYSLGKYQRLDYVHRQYLAELSTTDPLTRVYNRLMFNEALRKEIELARRYNSSFSLIMFDIDHFKQFNDKKGHSFGDKILVSVSSIIKDAIRGVDLFARWGGEEFVILLPQTSCQDAAMLAERLRRLVHSECLKQNLTVTCSFGVTSYYSGDTEFTIMDRVDQAMYRAKQRGRNTVETIFEIPDPQDQYSQTH